MSFENVVTESGQFMYDNFHFSEASKCNGFLLCSGVIGTGNNGKLPQDMKVFHDMSACPPAHLPKDPTDMKAMLTVLVNAERCAVKGYTHLCNLTAGKDHRTYDLCASILNEEIEHECWFSEFLGKGPSGHFLRRGETSPFVGKFLR